MTQTLATRDNHRPPAPQEPGSSITLILPHDVRSPLTGILTAARLLEAHHGGLEQHEVQRITQIIQRSADRLDRLVQNLLLCAQLKVASQAPGEAPPRPSALTQWMAHMSLDCAKGQAHLKAPASVIVEAALRQARCANREADLTIEVDGDTLQMVETHLQKIVGELLDNAFRFSKAGTPVRVTGNHHDHRFALSIADNGRGMTAEQVASAGVYIQPDRYEQQGLGLGLVIAKRLTELYGGELTIESTPGKGTTVQLLFPA